MPSVGHNSRTGAHSENPKFRILRRALDFDPLDPIRNRWMEFSAHKVATQHSPPKSAEILPNQWIWFSLKDCQ